MFDFIKKNKEILVLCALYAIISFVLFGLMTGGNAIIAGDSSSYIRPAKNLLLKNFFSGDGMNAEYLRTPGYPFFLAIIYSLGGNNTTVVIIQIILMAIKVYFFYRILIMLRVPKKLALLGSLLLLCNIQSYGYSFAIMTEPLFGFLLMLSLYLWVKQMSCERNYLLFIAFCIALNCALFVRPILMYFIMFICFVLLFVLFIKKIKILYFGIFTLCFIISFGGWSYRNYLHSGIFIFSTIQKSNMQRYYAPIITAGSEYMKNNDVQGFIEGATNYHNEMFLQKYPEIENKNLNAAQVALLRGEYGSRFIRANFSEYISVNITGFLKMMFTSFQTPLLFKATALSPKLMLVKAVQLLYSAYIIILYILCLVGFVVGFKKCDIIQISIFIISGYLAAAGAIFASVRFRDPFFPLLLLSAVSSSGIIIQWLSRKTHSPVIQRIEKYLLHESDIAGNS